MIDFRITEDAPDKLQAYIDKEDAEEITKALISLALGTSDPKVDPAEFKEEFARLEKARKLALEFANQLQRMEALKAAKQAKEEVSEE